MRAALAVLAVLASVAWPRRAGAVDVALDVGAIEVIGTSHGNHYGVYPYVGVSLVAPAGPITLLPTVSVEWSPEFDRWGFVGALIGDYALTDRLGVDGMLVLLHDQAGTDWDEAAFYLGVGAGVSVFVGKLTISPSLGLYRALDVDAWTFVPGLNAAWTL
jgi:hypothetical protein